MFLCFLPFKRPLKPIRISGKIKSTKSETSGLREPRSRCIHSRSSSDSRSKDWCLTLYLAPWFRLSVEFGVCNLFSYFFPCSLMKPDKTIPWIVKKPPPVRWVVFFFACNHGDSVLLRLVLDTTPPDFFCLSFDEMSVIVQDKVETMESWNHFQQHHEKHCRKITIKSCDKERQSLYLLQSTWLHGDLEICWKIIQSTIPAKELSSLNKILEIRPLSKVETLFPRIASWVDSPNEAFNYPFHFYRICFSQSI